MQSEISARELNDAERTQLLQFTQLGLGIVRRYLGEATRAVNLQTLDKTFDAWRKDGAMDKPRPNELIHGLGTLLGALFAKRSSLEWRIVTDRFGTGMALFCKRTPSGHKDIVLAPIDMVGTRIEQAIPFFMEIFAPICRRIDELGVPLRASISDG